MKNTVPTILLLFLLTGCTNSTFVDKEADKDGNVMKSETQMTEDKFSIAALHFDEQNMSAELHAILDMIQNAYDSGELKYVGEEDMGAGVKRYKLAFPDEEIIPGILISLSPINNFDPEYMENYSRNAVILEFSNQKIMDARTKIIHMEVGKIDKGELNYELGDPNVKNALLKSLISQQQNITTLIIDESLEREGKICEEPAFPSLDGKDYSPAPPSPLNMSDQELADVLRPLLQKSEVMSSLMFCYRDELGKIGSFDISLQVMGNLKKQ